MIFLDTNVTSEVMRPKPNPQVIEWLSVNSQDLAISTVLIAEISFGILKLRSAERSPRLAAQLEQIRKSYADKIYSFDEASALIYGDIMGSAHHSGRPVHTADGMIASIALRHNAVLATRNVKDFEALGVKTVNPWN